MQKSKKMRSFKGVKFEKPSPKIYRFGIQLGDTVKEFCVKAHDWKLDGADIRLFDDGELIGIIKNFVFFIFWKEYPDSPEISEHPKEPT